MLYASTCLVGHAPDRPDRPGGPVLTVRLGSPNLTVEMLSLGATLTSAVHLTGGSAVSLVQGLPDWSAYDDPAANHLVGSTMGRWCRYVKDPDVRIDGLIHRLATNDSGGHAHGGPAGFTFQNWAARIIQRTPDSTSVVFEHVSPAGHQGYPGRLKAAVEYNLSLVNGLTVSYRAVTTAPTLCGLANHVYWRIGEQPVDDHEIQLPASRRVGLVNDRPVDGPPTPVYGPDDFRARRKVGPCEIDTFYVADTEAAVWRIGAPQAGVDLEFTSTDRGAGVYTGDRDPVARRGICLEFGGWPGAEHRDDFPSPVLRPGLVNRSSWTMRVEPTT